MTPPTSPETADIEMIAGRLSEAVSALKRIRLAGLNVLVAMDDYNAAHGTHIGGGAFFEISRAIHQADKALAHLRSGDPQ